MNIRAFVDGEPTNKMKRLRAEAIDQLWPPSKAWAKSPWALAKAAYESGWDDAVLYGEEDSK